MFGLTKAERIKKTHSLDQVIGSYGVKLKPTSQNKFSGLCPFHEDHNPSLAVDAEKGRWICFAGCGSGSVIDFVMKAEGIPFKDAVSKLEGFELPNGSKKRTADSIPDLAVLQDAVGYYHRCLLENKDAQDYLKKRGIFSPELVDRFRIGYADGSLRKLLHGEKIEAAQRMGLLSSMDPSSPKLRRASTEVFTGYVVFPVEDETGAVVNLYGRLVAEGNQAPSHRYLKGPNRGVFNWKALKAHKDIVLVESIIDCLSMHVLDIPNCIPLYGTQGLTKDHLKLFEKYETEEVILLMDNDQAGEKAAESIVKRLGGMDLSVLKVPLPEGITDPNDLLLKRGSEIPIEKLFEGRQYLSTPENAGNHNGNGHVTLDHSGIKFTARGLRSVTDTSMKVLLEARKNGSAHTDRLDLYVSRSRRTFVNAVSKGFDIQKAKIEKALTQLIKDIETKHREKETEMKPAGYVMGDREKKDALAFLRSHGLLDKINSLIGRMGYVGEDAARRLAYLVAVSSRLDSPLSLLVRSNSSAGKSDLMEKVVTLIPDEDVFFLSRISPQALYYMGDTALAHKLVIVDEKHGAEEAEYSIRNLQSRKKLSMAVVMKDPQTGKSKTVIFEVAGPIAYMDSSTSTRDNPENENRCFVVYLDESSRQTKAILASQKHSRSLKGKRGLRKLAESIITAKNAVRLLDSVKVTIPFLDRITFPSEYLRARRDHSRFLNLIESIAFLHQYQRERKHDDVLGEYIEATVEDYRIAYDLVRSTVGTTYGDIPRNARIVLEGIKDQVGKAAEKESVDLLQYEFTRRRVRSWLRLSNDQVKRALRNLVDLEYLIVTSGGRGRRHTYRLAAEDIQKAVIERITAPEAILAG